jgi:hypothetical protein
MICRVFSFLLQYIVINKFIKKIFNISLSASLLVLPIREADKRGQACPSSASLGGGN